LVTLQSIGGHGVTDSRSFPIGIFDSGVGGLTVARRVMEDLPNESIIYFGDTARAPYGVLPTEKITEYSMEIMRFLMEKRMKMVIIACNTICVSCYYELAGAFDIPMFEIVSPAADACVDGVPREGMKIGVIATEATVRSGAYMIELLKRHPYLAVYQKACPELVLLAERGFHRSDAARQQCDEYLKELKEEGIERLILGCTHFPLYYDIISELLAPGVRLIDPAVASAAKVKALIKEAGLENPGPPVHEFYITGETDAFEEVARNILGMDIKAKRAELTHFL
jgi:glutamate racemase